ncbi:MAG: hypothetical protein WCV90_05530 [Candidatus Woesearchaeota archaeon]
MTLKKLIIYAVMGIGLASCQLNMRTFIEEVDLNGDGSKERVMVCSGRHTSIEIQELNQVRATKGGLLGSAYLTYDNLFFNRGSYFIDLPIVPNSIGFRDTNEDGYLDLLFHSEENNGLESYVAEQTGDGGINQPRKININPYLDLDQANDLYERSISFSSRRDFDGAIHLAEWSLEFLDPNNPIHHRTLLNEYQLLLRLYEQTNNQKKTNNIKTKELNLRLFRARI